MGWVYGLMTGKCMSEEQKYARIWKSMEHCVNVCILSTFRSVREIFCGCNWVVVHERCVHIITKHMKELSITDPHEFDKAVCWEAVTTGKDRDPLWRCICSFFFAAAMQIDKVQRMKHDEVKKVTLNPKDSWESKDDLTRQIADIIKELKQSRAEMHKKLDDSKTGGGNTIGNTGGITHVSHAQSVVNNHVHHFHPPGPTPGQDPDEYFKGVLNYIKGYDPKGEEDGVQSSYNNNRSNKY